MSSSDELLRPELVNPKLPGNALYVSNIPYHVHAGAIQGMLDADELTYVRCVTLWLPSHLGNALNGVLPVRNRSIESDVPQSGKCGAGTRRSAQAWPKEQNRASWPSHPVL